MAGLTSEVIEALLQVMLFWFPLAWGLTLLLSLFTSLKYIFNTRKNRYELKLYECSSQEMIEEIGYGDIVKVWRKWFMAMIWLVGVEMIISLFLTYALSLYENVFEWFNIYILFTYILLAGYISFILLAGRCKKVKLRKC